MNKFLEKIAKSLPYRDRVEVLIRKDDKILVMKCKNKGTGEEWWAFPGGGVDGQDKIEAAQNECLEEVGVRVKNITPTKFTHTEEGGMSKKDDRHLKYRGSKTRWYVADYDQMDRSKLGEDDDSRRYAWKTHQEALQAVKSGRGISIPRQDLIASLKGSKSVLEKVATLLGSGLYHLSEKPLDNLELHPRVPKNFLTENGYEDSTTKRVSMAPTVSDALLAMSSNLKGKRLYVYRAPDGTEHLTPSPDQVPDSVLTNEKWITGPVKVELAGEILVGDAIEEPKKYKYGKHTAELYGWNWEKAANEVESRFQPDLTPDQMKQLGVLAKQYFNKDPKEANYFHTDASLNKWPKTWIDGNTAPHGWFEWYIKYSKGIRTPDDERQMKRWISFKARHLAQLQKADPTLTDLSVQPRRRQALLNWGIAPGINKDNL